MNCQLSVNEDPSRHNKVSSQYRFRKSFLSCFPSFLIYDHLSLSLPRLSNLHYLPLSLVWISAHFLYFPCPSLFAFLVVEEARPRPAGCGVPDGLAGRGFTTDPSAADPVLPQTPGGWERTHVSRWEAEDRRTGENCVTAEPVIYGISDGL